MFTYHQTRAEVERMAQNGAKKFLALKAKERAEKLDQAKQKAVTDALIYAAAMAQWEALEAGAAERAFNIIKNLSNRAFNAAAEGSKQVVVMLLDWHEIQENHNWFEFEGIFKNVPWFELKFDYRQRNVSEEQHYSWAIGRMKLHPELYSVFSPNENCLLLAGKLVFEHLEAAGLQPKIVYIQTDSDSGDFPHIVIDVPKGC